ncbi:MAG: chromosomal replication initiator protein DnaA [Bryobacteraceae bacterium]|jgi:chromosomal replication initiator protein
MVETNAWELVKQALHVRMKTEAFHNWVARTELLEQEGNRLRILVPDEVTRHWLEGEYAGQIQSAIQNLNLHILKVHYELAGNGGEAPFAGEDNGTDHGFQFPAATDQLNPRLTFDSFVVGSCNQFAHAAAKAVASTPSKNYNPLFIYGVSGMGKTHLIHAIGHAVMQHWPSMRLVYTTGERFVNEMVYCLRGGRMTSFQAHYRTADILLIDDIHTVAGKERTQEEFFHTFNTLYDHQKQLVMSSDSLPKDMKGLVERLRTRFEWGLMVDVQPPDLETKMAILDMKAAEEGVRLPEDVRIFIATKTKTSVRELEGAFTKLVAYSSVTAAPVTLDMARQVLKPMLHNNERRVTIDSVMRAVAERFDLQPSQLKQKTNAHEISRPRQIAMYLVKELTSASLPEIGRHFGGKHHTTVLHSVRKVDEMRQNDPDLNNLIHNIIDSFH